MIGKFAFALDEGVSMEEAQRALTEAAVNNPEFLAEMFGHDSPTEENPPTDPELTREVELGEIPSAREQRSMRDVSPQMIGQALSQISTAFGAPVLLESFAPIMPIGGFVKPGKQPLYKVLIGLEKAGYTWDRGDGVFRIRPGDWAIRRSYEISEDFLTYYKDLLDKQGEFTLDDLAAMAAGLTDDQIKHVIPANEDLPMILLTIASDVCSNTDILRLYGSLSARQREALASESGLSLDGLTDAQWEWLDKSFEDQLLGDYLTGGSIRLVTEAPPEPDGKVTQHAYRFMIKVQIAAEEKPRNTGRVIMTRAKELVDTMIKERPKAREVQEKAAGEQANNPPPPRSKSVPENLRVSGFRASVRRCLRTTPPEATSGIGKTLCSAEEYEPLVEHLICRDLPDDADERPDRPVDVVAQHQPQEERQRLSV
jgi:hypothetical protein